MKKLLALLIKPECNIPDIIVCTDDYIEKKLGKDFNILNLKDDVYILCHRDGISQSENLPICRKVYHTYLLGDLIIVGYNEENEKFKSLNIEELSFYQKEFSQFESYITNADIPTRKYLESKMIDLNNTKKVLNKTIESNEKDINNIEAGDLVIIGNLDNDISQHFSECSPKGLLEYREVRIVKKGIPYISIFVGNRLLELPKENIYKFFKNEESYQEWVDDYLNRNKEKIENLAEKKIDDYYDFSKSGIKAYLPLKYFYDDAISEIAYDDFVNKKLEIEMGR